MVRLLIVEFIKFDHSDVLNCVWMECFNEWNLSNSHMNKYQDLILRGYFWNFKDYLLIRRAGSETTLLVEQIWSWVSPLACVGLCPACVLYCTKVLAWGCPRVKWGNFRVPESVRGTKCGDDRNPRHLAWNYVTVWIENDQRSRPIFETISIPWDVLPSASKRQIFFKSGQMTQYHGSSKCCLESLKSSSDSSRNPFEQCYRLIGFSSSKISDPPSKLRKPDRY
jgi:hypothetical protein